MSTATRTHTPTMARPRRFSRLRLLGADRVDDRLAVGLCLLGHGARVSLGRLLEGRRAGAAVAESTESRVTRGTRRRFCRPTGPRPTASTCHAVREADRGHGACGRPRRAGAARAASSSPPVGRCPERRPVLGGPRQRADDGLAGAVAEHVAALGAHQRGGAGPVLAGRQHQVGAPADDGERPAGRACPAPARPRPASSSATAGSGHRERVAVRVGAPGVVLDDAARRRRWRCRSGPRARPGRRCR